MKLSTQIALIISALVLPLSAYAEEGENSKQTITVQPQTEIATRSVPQHAGGGGGRFGVVNTTSVGGGGGFNANAAGGGGLTKVQAAKVQADYIKGETSAAASKAIFNNAKRNELVDKLDKRENEKENKGDSKSEKNLFERLWDRIVN